MASASPDPLTERFDARVAGNAIAILPSGPQRLAALLALIAEAQHTLALLFYFFAPDASGTRVRDALAAAASRGVKVTVLLDSFGSSTTSTSFFAPLVDAGGIMRWFGTRWTPRYLIRNHQKLVVADRDRAMSGGFNIADAYFGSADAPHNWQDIGVLIEGPAVRDAMRWFDTLDAWLAAPNPRFRDLRRLVRRWDTGAGPVRWLVGGPVLRRSSWARALRQAIGAARHLAISTAYFSPDAAVLRRIGSVTRRGGTTHIVLPARSDNAATVGAARLLYGFLLKRRAALFEFEPSLLHNKLIVADDVVLVGSANLDMRSLYLNLELVLRIEDSALAARCRALITAQQAQSTAISPALHKARASWFNRLRWFAAWLVVGALDYSVTRRLNLGLEDEGPE